MDFVASVAEEITQFTDQVRLCSQKLIILMTLLFQHPTAGFFSVFFFILNLNDSEFIRVGWDSSLYYCHKSQDVLEY